MFVISTAFLAVIVRDTNIVKTLRGRGLSLWLLFLWEEKEGLDIEAQKMGIEKMWSMSPARPEKKNGSRLIFLLPPYALGRQKKD